MRQKKLIVFVHGQNFLIFLIRMHEFIHTSSKLKLLFILVFLKFLYTVYQFDVWDLKTFHKISPMQREALEFEHILCECLVR